MSSFLVISLSGFEIRAILALQNELESVPSSLIFGKACKEFVLILLQMFENLPCGLQFFIVEVFKLLSLFLRQTLYRLIQIFHLFLSQSQLSYFPGICPFHPSYLVRHLILIFISVRSGVMSPVLLLFFLRLDIILGEKGI